MTFYTVTIPAEAIPQKRKRVECRVIDEEFEDEEENEDSNDKLR